MKKLNRLNFPHEKRAQLMNNVLKQLGATRGSHTVPLAFLIVFALTGLVACSPKSSSSITIGGGPNVSMLVIIAQKLGFFEKEGLDVEFRPLQTSKIAFDAVSAGQIDLGIVTDANIALLAYSGLENVRIIGSVMTKTDDAIIARRDSGIRAIGDLTGKRIGYTPASSSEAFLDLFLKHNGIKADANTLVTMSAPAMLAAMEHGDVDAVSVWQPFRHNIASVLGQRGMQFLNDDIYRSKILLIATADTASSRKDVLAKLSAILAKTAEAIRSKPAESIALVAPDAGIEPATLAATWNEYDFDVNDTKTLAADLSDIASALTLTEPALRTKPVPDYHTYFTFDGQTNGSNKPVRP